MRRIITASTEFLKADPEASVIAMDAEFNDRILRIGDDMFRHVPPDEDCSKAWRALP